MWLRGSDCARLLIHPTKLLRARIGAARGGRNLISAWATPRSQPLSYGRELVETLGLEPRFSGCRPEVLPLNDVPINHKTNVAAAGLTALGPGFRAPAGSMATTAYGQKMKNPSR